MAVDIGPKIGIEGEKQFRKNLQDINQQLKTMGSEMKAVTSAFENNDDAEKRLGERTRILNSQIELQEKKLAELKKGLQMATDEYGAADAKTQRWQQSVHDATAELNRMQKELRDSEKGISGLTDETKDAELSFIDFGKSLKKGLAAGAIVAGVKEIGSALMGVIRDTQEYRTIMASLEVSSKNAGYTAEQTAITYKQLYSVLGDTQTAATATANLQAIGLSQASLMSVTDAAVGAWSRYGDSIPIDGLAEAINETISVGKATANFTDLLTWAGVSEDEFNAKLEAANDSTERANIVLQELARQGLTDAGKAWRQNNEDITAVNEAQAEWDEATARLGEMLAPLGASIINFGADAIGALVDWLQSAIENTKAAYEWLRKFFDFESRESRRHELLPSAIDGSHANGLDYVPFDGYLAKLHRGEMVLTKAQADMVRSTGSATERMNSVAAGIVNGVQTAVSGAGGNYRIEIPLYINGREFYRASISDLRSVMRDDPEV